MTAANERICLAHQLIEGTFRPIPMTDMPLHRARSWACIGPLLLTLAGCATSSFDAGRMSKDDYRTTFKRVVQKSLDETTLDNICLPPIFGLGSPTSDTFEINVETDFRNLQAPQGRLGQARALESVGLLLGVEAERAVNGKRQKIVTFTRTPLGAVAFREGTFCYARAELDQIIKWKGPIVLGEYRAAFVYYTTKTTHVSDWARASAVQAAFPTVAPIVNGGPAKVRTVAIDYSSEGWDVAEYSKLLQLQ